jgi:thioredoxin-like negative regulator of GroEL
MELIELNKDTIATEITKNSISVIEFYYETCSVCKMLMPILPTKHKI